MAETFKQWAIIEIMGHQRYAGFVTEQSIGGASFVRVDVPENGAENPAFTKLFGAGSIYAITPVAEHVARLASQKLNQVPITLYDLPESIRDRIRQPLLPAQPNRVPEEFEEDDDSDDEQDDWEGM